MLRYKNIGDLLIDNSLGCKVAITDSIALQIVGSPGRRQDLLLLKSIIKNQKDAQKDAQNQEYRIKNTEPKIHDQQSIPKMNEHNTDMPKSVGSGWKEMERERMGQVK